MALDALSAKFSAKFFRWSAVEKAAKPPHGHNKRFSANRTELMDAHAYELSIRTLIYKEDESYVAHALEMDILAYGKTEKEACDELKKLLTNQLIFAALRGDPSMVYFPAPDEFFKRWEEAHAAKLKGAILPDRPLKWDAKAVVAVVIPLSSQIVKRAQRPGAVTNAFSRTPEDALA